MRTQNSPNSPDDFYRTLQEAKERYVAKMEEFKDNEFTKEYYSGRLDATLFLMTQFEIMFWEVQIPVL